MCFQNSSRNAHASGASGYGWRDSAPATATAAAPEAARNSRGEAGCHSTAATAVATVVVAATAAVVTVAVAATAAVASVAVAATAAVATVAVAATAAVATVAVAATAAVAAARAAPITDKADCERRQLVLYHFFVVYL
jgi:hypothetical protein